jgi:LysM repeat protein
MIASRNEVSVADLKKWNGLSSTIAYGQNLKIIATETTVVSNPSQSKKDIAVVSKGVQEDKIKKGIAKDSLTDTKALYVVQNGDNISTIAEKYKVTVAQLWNNLTDTTIRQGTSLQIALMQRNS